MKTDFRRVVLGALVTAAAACGPADQNGDGITDGVRDPDSVTLVAPSTPQGTVSGQVLTTRLVPLEGAAASLNVGTQSADGAPRTATTSADGAFSFTSVPGGSEVLVSVAKEGFATLRTRVTVPSTAGNFPINNGNAVVGPFALTELNGQIRFMVINRSGRPAKGAKVTVQASPAAVRLGESGVFSFGQGAVLAEAVTDDSGIATLTGVPSPEEYARINGRYDVAVPPLDENNDGVYESAGAYTSYTGLSLMLDPSPRVIELADARSPGPLQILATNVPSLIFSSSPASENLVKPGEPIYIVFNQAIEPKSVLARLTDEAALESLGIAATVGDTGNVLQLTPAMSLLPGKEFNLSIRVTSLDSGSTLTGLGFLFAGDLGQPFPPALESIRYADTVVQDGSLSSGETVHVRFTTPLGLTTGSGGLQAFINADINASGSIGDAAGETGATSGFPVYANEPTGMPSGKFAVKPSGYSTYYQFTYSGTAPVAAQTNVVLAFERIQSAYGEYQTVWGEPVTKNVNAGLTILP